MNIRPEFRIMVIAALVAAVLVVAYIGSESIWLDEAVSIMIAHDWDNMWRISFQSEANMWLYHTVLHFWLQLGQNEVWIRLLSAIFAIATVPVVLALGARLVDPRAGAIAAFVLAANVYFIQYAQEARSYSLLLFLVTVSSYYFVSCIERPARNNWVGYIFSSVLALYAHFFGALALGAHALSVVFLRRRDIPWGALVLSYAAMLLLLVPILFSSFLKGASHIAWIEQPNVLTLYHTVQEFAGSAPTLVLVYLPLSVIAIVSAVRTFRRCRFGFEAWRVAFLVMLFLAPILFVFSFSLLVKPIFVPRYLIFCLIPFVLLVAAGFGAFRARWIIAGLATVLVLSSGRSIVKLYTERHKEDWRSATAFVLSQAKPHDAVLFYAYFVRYPFEYYLTRFDAPSDLLNLLELAPDPDSPPHGSDLPAPDQDLLESVPEEYSRVWLVLSHDDFPRLGRDVESRMIQSSLVRNYGAPTEHEFYGVRLLLYDRISIARASKGFDKSTTLSSGQGGLSQNGR